MSLNTIAKQNGWRFTIPTPDGKLTVFVVEKRPGEVDYVQAFLGKAGHSVSAWVTAATEMINELLKQGVSLADIIARLSSITTGKSLRLGDGIECRSGPEGIMLALMRYRNSEMRVLQSDRRPPRFTNRG